MMKHTVTLRDGAVVPALGQGTWCLGEHPDRLEQERQALLTVEYDLLPWMRKHDVALMAYCPLAQAGGLRRGLYHNRLLLEIAEEHNAAISQILLAFAIRDGHTISIPRTGKSAHTIENAGADAIDLTEDELREIGRLFPAPTHKTELDMQ